MLPWVTAGGGGIANAFVTVSGGNLPNPITIRTSNFGYYKFQNLDTGEEYTVSVSTKQFSFTPATQTITLNNNVSDLNFVAD